MNKFLVLVIVLLVVTGCGQPPLVVEPVTPQAPALPPGMTQLVESAWDGDVFRFVDEEAEVVCYLYDVYRGGGIDCLPLSQTALNVGR